MSILQLSSDASHSCLHSMCGARLLAQIESDHLLAILIEIPSDIDDLLILDIVVEFKLETFLEFHRLKAIFWEQALADGPDLCTPRPTGGA